MNDLRCFSKHFLSEFIELYKSSPCLWKIKSADYSNRDLKNKAYDVLINKMREVDPDANRESVLRKIDSLRGSFRKELKKVKKSELSGVGPDDLYQPRLWYFDKLLFLSNQYVPKEKTPFVLPSVISNKPEESSSDRDNSDEDHDYLPSDTDSSHSDDSTAENASIPDSQLNHQDGSSVVGSYNKNDMDVADEESTNDAIEEQNFQTDESFLKMPEESSIGMSEESTYQAPEETSHRAPEEPSFRVPEGVDNKKRKRNEVEDIEKYMSEACKYMQFIAKKPQKDMCSQFADLVATKLRSFDEDTRDSLMNEIDNLIFRVKQSMRGKNPHVPSGGAIYSINNSVINFPNFHPMPMNVAQNSNPGFPEYDSPQPETDPLSFPAEYSQETSENNIASTISVNNFDVPVNGFEQSVPTNNSVQTKNFTSHLDSSHSKAPPKDPTQLYRILKPQNTSSTKPPQPKQKLKHPNAPAPNLVKSHPVIKQRNVAEPVRPQSCDMSLPQSSHSSTESQDNTSRTQSLSPHQFFPPNYFPVPPGWPPYSHPFPTNASPFPWQPSPHPNQFQRNSPHSVSSPSSMQSSDPRNERSSYNAS